MSNIYTRGSEWVRCDLHVHTPCSIEQQYGGDTAEVWKKFISDLESLSEDFKIIGINDYNFIDGYIKVLDYKKAGRLSNIDLILPVIELRLDKFGNVSGNDALKRVNYHIIFANSEILDPKVIQEQFLNGLSSEYDLTPKYNSDLWKGIITRDSLIDLGQKIIDTSNGKEKGSPLHVGFNNLTLTEKNIKDLLKSSYFKNKFLLAVGKTEWDALRLDGSAADKKHIINSVDFVFTASENEHNYYKAKENLTKLGVNNILIDCSDAHDFSDSSQKDRIGNCLTWVKINPTFEGLKFITYEPEERLYIGTRPEVLNRVDTNRHQYIDHLIIDQNSDYDGSKGIWFKNQKIEFNKELTTIIGNKGKGKSAITDIIGLGGNSKSYDYFSFLHKNKFLKKKLASNFNATLAYFDKDDKEDFQLDDVIQPNSIERVKYLPQDYFDRLCSDIDNNAEFQSELEEVVFGHLDITERRGKANFDEFIDDVKNNAEGKIKPEREAIEGINHNLSRLFKKQSTDNVDQLTNRLKELKSELKTLDKNKPDEVDSQKQQDSDIDNTASKLKQLDSISADIKKATKKREKTIAKLTETNTSIADLQRIRDDINTQFLQVDLFRTTIKLSLNKYDLDIENIFSIEQPSFQEIDDKINVFEIAKGELEVELGKKDKPDNYKGKTLIEKITAKEKEYIKITTTLNSKQKEIEEQKELLKQWKKKKKKLIGDLNTANTIKFIENDLKYITKDVPSEIQKLKNKRKSHVQIICREKSNVIDIYKKLKENIDSTIDKHKIETYKVSLEASFSIRNFASRFLDHIDRSRTGSFYGKDQSELLLERVIKDADVDTEEGLLAFLDSVNSMVENIHTSDSDDDPKSHRNMDQQMRSSYTLAGLLNYTYCLVYLEENYNLKFGGKDIEQLSPGERGAVLIVFYLLLDKNDIPLVIDQPEDNLDNQSVFEILVPYIKAAKKRRQIVIVTHNPNLAVVADSEQIIHVQINKEDGTNEFSFTSGGIENDIINKCIVDILEGTEPAFDKRKLKYSK